MKYDGRDRDGVLAIQGVSSEKTFEKLFKQSQHHDTNHQGQSPFSTSTAQGEDR